jgi:hypothetical protein
VTTVTLVLVDLLWHDVPRIENSWLIHMVAEVSGQRLEDRFHRSAVVMSDKMFDIFEQEGGRTLIADYSGNLKEQRTLSFVSKAVSAP